MNLGRVIASEARQSMTSDRMDWRVASLLATTNKSMSEMAPSDSKFNSNSKGIL